MLQMDQKGDIFQLAQFFCSFFLKKDEFEEKKTNPTEERETTIIFFSLLRHGW